MIFKHAYTDADTFQIIGEDGRVYSPVNTLYKEYIKRNKPAVVSGDRFVSIIDGKPVVDPKKEIILADEKALMDREMKIQAEERRLLREQAIKNLVAKGELTAAEAERVK